jgi:hypothetical protein
MVWWHKDMGGIPVSGPCVAAAASGSWQSGRHPKSPQLSHAPGLYSGHRRSPSVLLQHWNRANKLTMLPLDLLPPKKQTQAETGAGKVSDPWRRVWVGQEVHNYLCSSSLEGALWQHISGEVCTPAALPVPAERLTCGTVVTHTPLVLALAIHLQFLGCPDTLLAQVSVLVFSFLSLTNLYCYVCWFFSMPFIFFLSLRKPDFSFDTIQSIRCHQLISSPDTWNPALWQRFWGLAVPPDNKGRLFPDSKGKRKTRRVSGRVLGEGSLGKRLSGPRVLKLCSCIWCKSKGEWWGRVRIL